MTRQIMQIYYQKPTLNRNIENIMSKVFDSYFIGERLIYGKGEIYCIYITLYIRMHQGLDEEPDDEDEDLEYNIHTYVLLNDDNFICLDETYESITQRVKLNKNIQLLSNNEVYKKRREIQEIIDNETYANR